MQKIVNTDGTVGTISPFLIPQTVTAANGQATVPLYTADLGDVDHGHTGIAVGIDVDPGDQQEPQRPLRASTTRA